MKKKSARNNKPTSGTIGKTVFPMDETNVIPVETKQKGYSELQLRFIRRKIWRKLEDEKELLRSETGMTTNHQGTDDTHATFKIVESAADEATVFRNQILNEKTKERIIHLETILNKIENGTFGFNEKTHKLIPLEEMMRDLCSKRLIKIEYSKKKDVDIIRKVHSAYSESFSLR